MVVVYGMSDRLIPGLVTLAHSFTSGSRLEQPLTYWNAEGLLAAIGLFLSTTHWVFKWFATPFVPFFYQGPPAAHPWAAALTYAAYGLVLMLLGLWLAHRRGMAEPA